MSEALRHIDTINTTEVSLAAPRSSVDTREIPIIEIIRRKVGAVSQAAESEVVQLPGEVPERRGVITGRTHDEVVEDALIMREWRLKQRRRAASILGLRAV